MGGRGASSGRTGASRSTAASRSVAETNTTRTATPVARTATPARTAAEASQRPPFKREALIREYEENKARYKGLIADLERKMARTRNMSKWEELLDQKEEYQELLDITERDYQGWKRRGWV